MKTVLITGISGTNVAEYADNVRNLGNKDGKRHWTHIRFAELMYELDPERHRLGGYSKWEENILRREAVLPYLRRSAFDKLVEKIQGFRDAAGSENEVVIISSHATFWYRKTLLAGIDLSRIDEIDADIYVTLVDDVIDVWDRLLKTGQDRWTELNPVDILEWREIETFFTEQMAYYTGQKRKVHPFFVIARDFGPSVLKRILSEPTTPIYYRSYPITFVSKRPEVQREADRLGEKLEKTAIVFNPMGIRDWDRRNELKKRYEAWCRKCGFPGMTSGWAEIELHLKEQTVSRDHRLIDQAHGLAVYYPELKFFSRKKGRYTATPLVPFSSGVLDEMQYGTQRGKEILLVWTSPNHPGPFLPRIYSKKFGSVDDLLDFVRNRST